MSDRMNIAEENIGRIREDVGALRLEQVKQGSHIEGIQNTLVRHDGQFSEINRTLRDIQGTMQEISKTLAANTQSLQDHMRRTENLENRMAPMES